MKKGLGILGREQRQARGLKKTVKAMWDRVPLYRSRMEDMGMSPEMVSSVEDLQRLPFMTKDDLRDSYPMGLLACERDEVVRVHASSGTTGKPTVVAYTKGDITAWEECMKNCLATAGVTRGDVFQVILGYGLFTGALGFHYGAEGLGAMVVPTGGGFTERQLMLMEDLGTTVFTSTPSYALHLCEEIKDKGTRERLRLRLAILGGESWTEEMRERIEGELGVIAVDSYGLSEVIGPGVAMECPERSGLHPDWDHFLFEVVDPVTGRPLPEGEEGELVITSLTKEAMPVIRYRTRDLTRFIPGICGCGREGLRLERIKGRCDDMLIIRGVNVFPSQVEAVLGKIEGLSLHYRLEVFQPNGLKELKVLCEAEGWMDELQREEKESEAVRRLHENLGIRVGFRLLAPGALERSAGKAVRVTKVA
ncbi:MAG TPA: phenylacetate--CoA ligase [Synergistaceae bacterium]|nr:phenylacetate--CoA ligase [Synergistaceae bacterium]